MLVGFDASFYRNYYPDLRIFKTAPELAEHYIRHGAEEGRLKNPSEAIRLAEQRSGKLPADFNVELYKTLNEDLAHAFNQDWQFVLHYLQHGRHERRPYRGWDDDVVDAAEFLADPLAAAGLDLNGAWPHLLRLPEFIAYNHDWLEEVPLTAVDALRLFLLDGIQRLAPLNFASVFDPSFYRAAYPVDHALSNTDLYRQWLGVGLLKGWAPNEQAAIKPFVGDEEFPVSLDRGRDKAGFLAWRARHRIDHLRHFFHSGFRLKHGIGLDGSEIGQLFTAVGRYHLVRGHHKNALRALDQAIETGFLNSKVFHFRADTHAALGNAIAAYADYSKAASLPNASIWAHINAAGTAAEIGKFDSAFETIERASREWSKSAPFRVAQRELLESFFTAESRAAMDLYRDGRRVEADDRLLAALRRIAALITAEGLPAPIGPQPDGHIAILATLDLVQCKYYRVVQKVIQLEAAGVEARVCSVHEAEQFPEYLLGARAVIFYRVPAFPNVIRAILTAKALGIPTFYDIDDLIFSSTDYPDSFESFEGQISRQQYEGLIYGVPLHRYAMWLCDQGIASTTPLKQEMERVLDNRPCHVLRNALDSRTDKIVQLGAVPRLPTKAVSIFYGSATKSHNSDFNEIAGPAILAALEKYDHVRLVVAGHLQLSPRFDVFRNRIKRLEFTPDVIQYWAAMAASDVNLAVLTPGPAADCKSEIKWLEAAILRIPSIVSETATHREVLEDGVDALIAGDAESWTKALDLLVRDSELRQRLGAAARRKALNQYSLEHSSRELCRILNIEPALNQKPHSGKVKPITVRSSHGRKCRVLVCNVFFPPQLYGGATRVARDNVDYIIDNEPDIELSVFTSDEGVAPAGHFRFDQYRGIPVFRLSTPTKAFMDWEPFNADNEPIFERVMDVVQPDLVHFHCIQRLTASIVEVARRRGIPYVITVHDGWWLSDHQFLLDHQEVPRFPSPDYFDCLPPPGIDYVASVARRQRLAHILAGAVHVLAVSDTFASIYREAGCSNVLTIENGVPSITAVPRQRGNDGRLSLGHIGGRGTFKGATLIEAVLRTTPFKNLRLTMVDTAIEPGARRETVWGSTPVTLCGPYPPDQIADLYASLHVLLAPSTCVESFGLAAREARMLGLWVVASNRGAIGESIRNGVDGFVIDVANSRELRRVLTIMDADVARFSISSQPTRGPVRTADEQSADLVALYRSIESKGMVIGADSGYPLSAS